MRQLTADVREMVLEQQEYKDLLYQLTKRDLLIRYKQTAMGFGWAVFMPLLNTAIFSVIFMRVAPIDTGVPYPVFAYCGLWAWNWFAAALRFSLISLSSNPNLVAKVYFPREMLPTSAVIVSFVDFVVGAIVLAGMMIYYGVTPGIALLTLPLIVLVQALFTMAMALLVAMANLFYRDVKYLFEVVITVWMFATSVVYPIGLVDGRLGTLLSLNPMTPIIDAYRSVLLYGVWPQAGPMIAVASFSLVFLAGVWLWFHRTEVQFAENV